jgi:P4 family phage/plasmid primase-like protien
MIPPIEGRSSYTLGHELAKIRAAKDVIYRGDDVDIAELVLFSLIDLFGSVQYAEGQLWACQKNGIWAPLNRADWTWATIAVCGQAKIVTPGKTPDAAPKEKAIRLSRGIIDGTHAIALDLQRSVTARECNDSDFFADVETGITTPTAHFRVTEQGVEKLAKSPDHRSRHMLACDIADGWRGGKWAAFLADVFGDADAAEVQLLQEFVGACLFGAATEHHRAMILLGSGANGKSTFIDCVRALFPRGSVVSIPPQDFDDNNKGVLFTTARLNVVNETPTRGIIAGDAVKSFVSGDEVTRREVYQRPVTFRPRAGHLFAANQLPTGADSTDGFWRRWLVVRFARQFAGHEQVVGLSDTITQDRAELARVAAWAVEGMARLKKNDGYTIPASSAALTAEWRTDSNPVAIWLDDCCQVGNEKWEAATACYDDYRAWSIRNGFQPLNSRNLSQRLAELGVAKRRVATGNQYGLQVFRRFDADGGVL